MDVVEAIHARHSVRFFTAEPVGRDDIATLMSAASAAPSSWNSQPWHFYVATGEARERVTQAMSLSTRHLAEYIEVLGAEGVKWAERFYSNLGDAPVVIGVAVPRVEGDVDQMNEYIAAGCAIENILLVATDMGLGACNITVPEYVMGEVTEAFGVAADRLLISVIVVGHPAEEPRAPQHRDDIYTVLE